MATLDLKFIGGILLIVGTSLGGGLLALPVATSATGFGYTVFFLFLTWFAMTLGALFILEANLWLPKGANMISMADKTLGMPGKIVAWFSYLFLLYTLLSAYISGGGDVFNDLVTLSGFTLPRWFTTLMFVFIFAAIVYAGIASVDKVNSGLMYVKLTVYLLLLFAIVPHISLDKLSGGQIHTITSSIMVLITSFGFAIIVPSLRDYFNDDTAQLKKVIIIGSLFPLICYLMWNAAISGVIPRNGAVGLIALSKSEHATSGLANLLQQAIHNQGVTSLFRFFSSICMLTAFLGVSLCLFDFLADGLGIKKRGLSGLVIASLVFIPPLLLVLFHPGIYLSAFAYAGFFCIILLLLLPALMVWRGRYHLQLKSHYQVMGKKSSLIFVILFSVLLFFVAI